MGVFDDVADIFATYAVELTFEHRIMGGVPKDPKIVQGWLRSKAGVEEARELAEFARRTMEENGVDVGVTAAQIAEADANEAYELMEMMSEAYAAERSTNGFKVGEHGLYIEDRQIKAMLKESVNVLFAGERWGKTKKGPKSFVAERVFITPRQIWLGREEPDGVETVVGHVSDKAGKRSTLTLHEYVENPIINFNLKTLRDEVTLEQWGQIWLHAQDNGLGALRSQSYGRFEVTKWERVA